MYDYNKPDSSPDPPYGTACGRSSQRSMNDTPHSSFLAALHPAPYGGKGGGATHGPHEKQKFDGGFGLFLDEQISGCI